jgi:hypothetical protein
MSASASRDEAVLPRRAGRGGAGTGRGIRLICVEAALAAVAFAALCVAVLSFAPQVGVEPDDGAYRASIVAMTEGDFLTLSNAQVSALAGKLGGHPPHEAYPARASDWPSWANVAQANSGTIEVRTGPHGSTFTLTFPPHPPAAEVGTPPIGKRPER